MMLIVEKQYRRYKCATQPVQKQGYNSWYQKMFPLPLLSNVQAQKNALFKCIFLRPSTKNFLQLLVVLHISAFSLHSLRKMF